MIKSFVENPRSSCVAGLCFGITIGLRVLARHCITGFLFNANGAAITISDRLRKAGVVDAQSLKKFITSDKDVGKLTFGIPNIVSSHHFLLRQWIQLQESNLTRILTS